MEIIQKEEYGITCLKIKERMDTAVGIETEKTERSLRLVGVVALCLGLRPIGHKTYAPVGERYNKSSMFNRQSSIPR
jgi:hypothetical protein